MVWPKNKFKKKKKKKKFPSGKKKKVSIGLGTLLFARIYGKATSLKKGVISLKH